MLRNKTLLFLAFIYLIYGTVLTMLSNEGFPTSITGGPWFPYLSDKPIGEDAYYMLTVAWNFANSGELIYNYGQRTCGVQPLVTFLYAGVGLMVKLVDGNKWMLIRAVLFLGIINLLIFAFLVRKITVLLLRAAEPSFRDVASELAFILTLFSFQLFRLFSYGLETGIYLTTFASCILYTLTLSPLRRIGMKKAIEFGLLVGVTILARVDFAFVFAVILILALIRSQMGFKETMTSGLVALLIQVPWLLYVHSVMGTYIQSSAYAQTRFMQIDHLFPRLNEMALAILSHFTPWVYSYVHRNPFGGGFVVLNTHCCLIIS